MAQKLKSGHIQLGAQRVEVRIEPKMHERERLYGEVRAHMNVIRLAGDVVATQAVDTLFHEIGHFLFTGSSFSDDDCERIAEVLGPGLASLFRDNPEWISTVSKIFRGEAKCQSNSTRNRKQTRARPQTKGHPDKPIKRRATRRT
jgi:hypothetical protein